MSGKQVDRNSWFERGAKALAAVGPFEGDSYMCPLCLKVFSRAQIEQLSIEHVPPGSLGGSPLVITCRKCNNESGYKLDAHAAHYNDVLKLFSGKSGHFQPVRLSVGDAQVNALGSFGGGIVLFNSPDKNKPGSKERLAEAFCNLRDPYNFIISYKPRAPISPFRANLSWLRAGYLAAFALFGYAFISRNIFDPIREQLEMPEEEALTHVGITIPKETGPDMALLVVNKPEWLRSLAVKMKRKIVFLPLFDDLSCIYPTLREYLVRESTLNFNSRLVFSWPTEPEHRLDFASEEEAIAFIDIVCAAARDDTPP